MKICRGHSSAVLVAFVTALILSATGVRVQSAAQASKPPAAPGGNAENGKKLFRKYGCYECHGFQGQGSLATGPRIGPDPVPFEVFAPYLRKPMGEMPPYTAKVVSDQDLADIYAFLQSLPRPPDPKSIRLLN
jgi:mono/diheme cytochrome c family protein